jgi:hypothetical protein
VALAVPAGLPLGDGGVAFAQCGNCNPEPPTDDPGSSNSQTSNGSNQPDNNIWEATLQSADVGDPNFGGPILPLVVIESADEGGATSAGGN